MYSYERATLIPSISLCEGDEGGFLYSYAIANIKSYKDNRMFGIFIRFI